MSTQTAILLLVAGNLVASLSDVAVKGLNPTMLETKRWHFHCLPYRTIPPIIWPSYQPILSDVLWWFNSSGSTVSLHLARPRAAVIVELWRANPSNTPSSRSSLESSNVRHLSICSAWAYMQRCTEIDRDRRYRLASSRRWDCCIVMYHQLIIFVVCFHSFLLCYRFVRLRDCFPLWDKYESSSTTSFSITWMRVSFLFSSNIFVK